MYPDIWTVNGKRHASPEYRSWQMMKNRCLNKRSQDYRYYGGRGISIDPRWTIFANFLDDMGRQPGPGYTLERKDGDKNYCKDNCEWATRKIQARNRAYVKLSLDKAIAIKSDMRTQIEIAKTYGVSQTLVSQVKRGVVWAEAGEVGHGV